MDNLPPEIRRHILSFLPTRIASWSSALSKDWHDEFCWTSTLKLKLDDGTDDVLPFISFVNRIVALRQPDPTPLRKFHLTIDNTAEGDQGNLLFEAANSWIIFALEKRLTHLTLCFSEPVFYLPESIFVATLLVKLKISTGHHIMLFAPNVNVHLPNLKSLSLDMAGLGDDGQGFYNLLRGCPVIEELKLKDLAWFRWDSCSVSCTTLKILSICWESYEYEDERDHRPARVSFVTPNLVYLKYNDDTALEYGALDFSSLVEADVLLHLRGGEEEREDEGEEEEELEMAGADADADASQFMFAIGNVQKLFLRADTLQVLAFGCLEIPTFSQLTELIIESHHKVDQLSDWDALPLLLNKCPHLLELVFLGLTHQAKRTCGDVCMCEGGEALGSCLKTSSVKLLTIYDFGQATSDMGSFVAMVTHFLESMPHLERFIVYCDGDASIRSTLSRKIRGISKKASAICKSQVLER